MALWRRLDVRPLAHATVGSMPNRGAQLTGAVLTWTGYALMLLGWLVLSSLLVSPQRIDRRVALPERVRQDAALTQLPMLPAARVSSPAGAPAVAPPVEAVPPVQPASAGEAAAAEQPIQPPDTPPGERWVQAFRSVQLWSGPGPDAISFGTAEQWRYFRIEAGPQNGRFYVYVPHTKNYAYVDADAVGPSGPPSPPPTNRIVIPKIGLDSKIVDVGVTPTGEMETAAYAVGRLVSSAQAGEAGNVVLAGHNDIDGEVFRYLDRLRKGDRFTLYRDADAYEYVVTDILIVREQGTSEGQRRENAKVLLPTEEPVATLITCWPYRVDTHRLIVRAALVQ
jgi:LPXTG-site transpeptidase (sortase) family protein